MSTSPSTPTPTPPSENSLPPISDLQLAIMKALDEGNAKWKKRDEELKAAAAARKLSKAKPETASR